MFIELSLVSHARCRKGKSPPKAGKRTGCAELDQFGKIATLSGAAATKLSKRGYTLIATGQDNGDSQNGKPRQQQVMSMTPPRRTGPTGLPARGNTPDRARPPQARHPQDRPHPQRLERPPHPATPLQRARRRNVGRAGGRGVVLRQVQARTWLSRSPLDEVRPTLGNTDAHRSDF